ncbi:MAG: hypothetical protein RLZZ502_129, partial [Pseudomonadota bacterium]
GFIASPASYPISGFTQPHGFFRFKLVGCTPGFNATISVTWPSLAGMIYTKYGKASAFATNNSFLVPNNLVMNGSTASFTVTDGQLGDNDWVINGEIVDPTGPVAPSLADNVAVPSLSDAARWVLLVSVGLLGFVALRRAQRGN